MNLLNHDVLRDIGMFLPLFDLQIMGRTMVFYDQLVHNVMYLRCHYNTHYNNDYPLGSLDEYIGRVTWKHKEIAMFSWKWIVLDEVFIRAARLNNSVVVAALLNNPAVKSHSKAFGEAIRHHHKNIEFMIRGHVPDYSYALTAAAEIGDEILVRRYMNASSWHDKPMKHSARAGHIKIIEMIIAADKRFGYESILYGAAAGGRLDVFSWLVLVKGMTFSYSQLFQASRIAAKNGQKDFLMTILVNADPNSLLDEAAKSGDRELVEFFIGLGADKFSSALVSAAKYGRLNIVKMMIDRGARSWDRAMYMAAYGGHEEVVNHLFEQGARWCDDCLLGSCVSGNYNIFITALALGAKEYNFALEVAAPNGHIRIVKSLLKLGASNRYNVINKSITMDMFDRIIEGTIPHKIVCMVSKIITFFQGKKDKTIMVM